MLQSAFESAIEIAFAFFVLWPGQAAGPHVHLALGEKNLEVPPLLRGSERGI